MTDGASEAEAILDLVRTRLAQKLRQEGGQKLLAIELTESRVRPYSLMMFLKASMDGGTRRVVLKQITDHPLNASVIDEPDQAAVEFGILTKVYPEFARIDRCAVPRPLLVLPEISAYVMDFVEGPLLADRLDRVHYWAGIAPFRRLESAFYDCGRWLRHFQEITGRRLAGASAVENVVVRCHDRLQLIEEARDRRIARHFCKRAADLIEKQVNSLKKMKILVTGRHGDFGPWNIIGSRNGITVLDFFGFREDPLPVDILSMLVALRSASYGLANRAARVELLEKSFVKGLGNIPDVPQNLVVLCEAQQRIQQIAGAVIEKKKGIMRRLELTRALRAHVRWFLERASRRSVWLE